MPSPLLLLCRHDQDPLFTVGKFTDCFSTSNPESVRSLFVSLSILALSLAYPVWTLDLSGIEHPTRRIYDRRGGLECTPTVPHACTVRSRHPDLVPVQSS